MNSNEKYFYKFIYVDGKYEWFELNENSLTNLLMDKEVRRIELKGAIINMDNVIKVITETQSDRDEKERLAKIQHEENMKAMENFKF